MRSTGASERFVKGIVDVFPEKLLGELHFFRDIQQFINLVPGSNIHNQSHHRMSPKEHE